MIEEMRVENYALINRAHLNFSPGFNALTGSTGTGKSIIINALSLLLGESGDVGSIRKEEEQALVEGVFSTSEEINSILSDSGIQPQDELLIKRIVSRKGGGRIYINGSIANLSILRKIGSVLFDIHGQHEHQLLLDEETHIDFLDSYGKLNEERRKVKEIYKGLRKMNEKLEKKQNLKKELSEKKELYEFQKKELEAISYSGEEYREMIEELKKLENFSELSEIISFAKSRLSEDENSLLDELSGINKSLKRGGNFDEELKSLSERMEEAFVILQDLSLELMRYADNLDYDEDRLTELTEIIDNITGLEKKYGTDYEGLIELREELENKVVNLVKLEDEIEVIKKEMEEKRNELEKCAEELSDKRKEASENFESSVESELEDLGFSQASFKVSFSRKEEIGELGKDSIKFLFEPNPGEGWKPFSDIASGGEISRVMLALKSILVDVDRVEGIVFDEIDVGIGGTLAKKLGDKMKSLGKKRQVLCVTHLPSIAAEADHHLRVRKIEKEGRNVTKVEEIKGEERINEIARMLSGEIAWETAKSHAKELLGVK